MIYISRKNFPKLVEPVKPVYSDIKLIISAVIPAVVSLSNLVETPV
jgi:hypothetical protein